MFSFEHIISIVIATLSMIFLAKWLRTKQRHVIDNILKTTAIVIFLLNPINWLWEILTNGHIDLALSLPLHLCSIIWALFPFAIFSKKQSAFKQIVFANTATVGLIGGILGFLMNSHLNAHAFFSFPVMRSLAYHYLMVFVAVLIWVCKVYVPQKSDMITFFIPVVALVLVCLYVYNIYGYEYCYVHDGAGTPLTILSDIMPRYMYVIVLYTLMFVVENLIFYNKFIFDYINKNKEKSKTKNGRSLKEDKVTL